MNQNENGSTVKLRLPKITVITMIFIIVLTSGMAGKSQSLFLSFILILISGAFFAFLFLLLHSPMLFLVPIVSYIFGVLFSHSFLYAIISLAYFPVALILWVCIVKQYTRSATILRLSVTLGVFAVFFFILLIIIQYKDISINIIKDYVVSSFDGWSEMLATLTIEVDKSVVQIYSDEQIQTMVNLLIMLIPSIFICIVNIFSYLIIELFMGILKLFKILFILPNPKWAFSMSVISAYVYIISYILTVLFGNQNNMLNLVIVTQNIILILSLGFTIMGIKMIIIRMKNANKKGIIGYIILFGLFIFINISLLISFVAFFGVLYTIIENKKAKRNSN